MYESFILDTETSFLRLIYIIYRSVRVIGSEDKEEAWESGWYRAIDVEAENIGKQVKIIKCYGEIDKMWALTDLEKMRGFGE